MSPPSACPRCSHPIRHRHNIPVVGWLVLRGRCADCGAPISARYPLVELGTGLLFAVTALMFGDHMAVLAAYLFFASISVALAGIDLDVRRLPDVIVLPSFPVLAVLLALGSDPQALTRAAIGASSLLTFYFLIGVLAPAAMGFGDVKMAGLVGGMTAYVSWGALITGAFSGFLFGALAGLMLMAAKRAGRRSVIPFGPFMLVGAWSAILGAGHLGDAYLGMVGA